MYGRSFLLHPAQREVFIDQLLDNDSSQYNIGGYIVLKGHLDVAKLHEAIASIPQVFDAFRMRFDFNSSDLVYYTDDNFNKAELIEVDLSDQEDAPTEALAWMRHQYSIPFKLNVNSLPFEHYLVKISENEHWLLMKYHHLINDGYGFLVSIEYIAQKYASLVSGTPLVFNPGCYADEIIRANEYYNSARYKDDEAYWQNKISNKPEKLLYKKYTSRSLESTIGFTYNIDLTKDQRVELDHIQQVCQASLLQLTTAALLIYFGKTSSSTEFVFGMPVHKRGSRQLRNTVGMFSGALPFKGNFNKDQTLTDLFNDIANSQKSDYRHYNYQAGDLSRYHKINSSEDHLFDVIVNYEKLDLKMAFDDGIDARLLRLANDSELTPLQVCWRDYSKEQVLQFQIQFCYEYFTQDEIALFAERILGIIRQFPDALSKNVGDINILPAYELDLLSGFSSSPFGSYNSAPSGNTILQQFEEQVNKYPDTIAILFEDEQISYKELNVRSNRLARYLQTLGVTKETLVPLCIERGVEMIVAILAIIKAGGAYVPLDADYPEERINYVIADIGAGMILTSSLVKHKFQHIDAAVIELDSDDLGLSEYSTNDLHTDITPDQLAYVIYTSGSTGRPKGVMIEHSSVVNLALGQAEALRLKQGTRSLQFSSFGFDASCYEIFNTLLSAGCLVMCTKDALLSTEGFKELVAKHKIELAVLPPSFQQTIDLSSTTLTTIVSAGEPLNEVVGKRIRSQAIRLINAYGPTESTVCATLTDKPIRPDGIITIGRPVRNTFIYVVNDAGELSPIGVPGEIYIGGDGVARGYLNRPELTADKFIADPYSKNKNARMYRTGDVGRWLTDGNIEYLGRKDDQLKIRGYRIEPGEIENVLLQSGLVTQAVVIAGVDKGDNKRLIGYVTPTERFDKNELETYLQGRLPEYMVPRSWVQMENFPLTPNGKIDKRNLPEPDQSEQVTAIYIAPGNEFEKKLASIWGDLLGIELVGIHDNFFELGGHSLLAMRSVSQLHREHGYKLTIRDIFNYPTIAGLNSIWVQENSDDELPGVSVQNRPEYVPLSYGQERLWFIDQLEGSVQYHVPGILRLSERPDVSALEYSFRTIVDRHEVLRTVIKDHNGQSYQQVNPKGQWTLKRSTIIAVDLDAYIKEQLSRPFNLSADQMLRVELIEAGEAGYFLTLVMHHIASDGWSMPLLVKEFVELYAGYINNVSVTLSPLAIQYADYAIWQRKYLSGDLLTNKLAYWKQKLEGVATLQLPHDHPRPAIQSFNGAQYGLNISKQQADKLHLLSLQEGATLYMTLLSVFKVLLYRYSQQEDICVGSPVANRGQHEVAGLIGFFVNMLALRTNLSGKMSFTDLLSAIKQTTLEAYEHQDVPFEKVVEAVVKERDRSRSPLFQVLFVLQNTPALPKLQLGDIALSIEPYNDHTSKFDLSLNLQETEEGISGNIEYNTDLYDEATIARIAGHFVKLIDAVIDAPDQVINSFELLSEKETEELLAFSTTASLYPKEKNIVSLFKEQVSATPKATAIIFNDEVLSYKALDQRSDRLARYLLKQGVVKETMVPICTERSSDMMVGILGILKAGGAYVPIDPEYPKDRVEYMLADTKADLMLISRSVKEKLRDNELLKDSKLNIIEIGSVEIEDKDEETATDLNITIDPDQLAYVIYTSGSTGKPKGALVEHGNVVSLVKGAGYFSAVAKDTLLVTGSPSFDATTFEYWSMLLNGGRLLLSSDAELFNSTALKAQITKYKVTTMWFTSSWFNQLATDTPEVFVGLSTILVGGEKLSTPHIKKIRELYPALQLINGYGPTENTTFSLTYPINDVDENGMIPIGRPLNGRTAYVLDETRKMVPIGVPGEIYLGGAGVARGYLDRPDLTAEKFIPDPFSKEKNARLYKTGDIGCWLCNKNIAYLGRVDDQVKIRGYRIEPGEIENVLLQSDLLTQAVIVAITDKRGSKRLVGYVITAGHFDKKALENYLQGRMPEYMVPRSWVLMQSFPLTANGKIDKRSLPDAEQGDDITTTYVAPRNELEIKLAKIWQELLGIESVGVHDNFFELGGHSLLAMRLVNYIERELTISIPISILFQFASIDGLSKYISIQLDDAKDNPNQVYTVIDI